MTAPDPRRRALRRLVAPAAAIAAAATGGVAWGAGPAGTPGPAARAGGAVDRVWNQVADTLSDAMLVTRIRITLLDHLKEDGLRVTIVARDGRVELSGAVKEPAHVGEALRAARLVPGVLSVSNRVTVAGPGGAEPPVAKVVGTVERGVSDALLDARVKARLLEDLGKVAFKIEVDASNGVVTLSGTVPDADRRRVAVTVAGATSGVREVRDRMKLPD